jgi:hypothetical protein
MSSAKRRINSTGRKRINQDNVELFLLAPIDGEPLKARLNLKLQNLELPPEAAILVEAYQRSSSMRFDCGTVQDKKIPELLSLNEIDRTGSVLFRVKIVDRDDQLGKILASADRLRPTSEADNTGRKSIFPVEYRDLAQEIWRVEIDDDAGPLLILNSRIPAITHRIHENPLLAGAILPAAFRMVLEYLAGKTAEEEGEGPGWKSEWLKFCNDGLGVSEHPDDLQEVEEREAWVKDTVHRFCAERSFVDRDKRLISEHTNG